MPETHGSTDSAGPWWSWRLLGRWLAVNTLAYVVIVVGGALLEELVSGTTKDLAKDHQWLAIPGHRSDRCRVSGVRAGTLAMAILRLRMPDLLRRRWVMATVGPALIV